MAVKLTIELPDNVFAILHTTPDSFIKEMCLAAAVKWYEADMISRDNAERIAKVSHDEFIEAFHRLKAVPPQVNCERMTDALALARI